MNLSSINTLCSQRKQQQLFNYLNLPPRIESQEDSPYLIGNVTQMQLDMRRKAEILKYNQGNTKANVMTKKQRFALVMNGKFAPVAKSYIKANTDISNSNTEGIVLTCNNKNLPITTPSSASGVPNDYINNINTLYLDPNVPLYNYINPVQTRSYGVINSSLNTNVILYSNYNNVITKTYSKISTVEFSDATENPTYTLNMYKIPLALNVYGDISGNVIDLSFDSMYIKIASIQLNVFYYNQKVVSTAKYTYTTDFSPYTEFLVDISMNSIKNNTRFSGTFFIGYLNIYNILLYSEPGYVYDFKLIIPVTYKAPSTVKNVNTYVVANVTLNNLIQNPPYSCLLRNAIDINETDTLGTFTIAAF